MSLMMNPLSAYLGSAFGGQESEFIPSWKRRRPPDELPNGLMSVADQAQDPSNADNTQNLAPPTPVMQAPLKPVPDPRFAQGESDPNPFAWSPEFAKAAAAPAPDATGQMLDQAMARINGREQFGAARTGQMQRTTTRNVQQRAAGLGIDPMEFASKVGATGDMQSKGLDEGALKETIARQNLERSLTSSPQEQRFRKLLAARGTGSGGPQALASIPDVPTPARDPAAIMADIQAGRATLNGGGSGTPVPQPGSGSAAAMQRLQQNNAAIADRRRSLRQPAMGGAMAGVGPNTQAVLALVNQGAFAGDQAGAAAALQHAQHLDTQDRLQQAAGTLQTNRDQFQAQQEMARQKNELDFKGKALAADTAKGTADTDIKKQALDVEREKNATGKGEVNLAKLQMGRQAIRAGEEPADVARDFGMPQLAKPRAPVTAAAAIAQDGTPGQPLDPGEGARILQMFQDLPPDQLAAAQDALRRRAADPSVVADEILPEYYQPSSLFLPLGMKRGIETLYDKAFNSGRKGRLAESLRKSLPRATSP